MYLTAGFAGLLFLAATFPAGITGADEFQFREPNVSIYQFEAAGAKQGAGPKWIGAHLKGDTEAVVSFGDRVVVRLRRSASSASVPVADALKNARQVAPATFILQARDAVAAATWADELSRHSEVLVACPVRRKSVGADSPYARKPNDRYYPFQAQHEFRGFFGERLGADLNTRSAWPVSTGEGVIVGIGDIGVELDHPDLATRGAAGLHYNFATDSDDGNPQLIKSGSYAHGTGLAGLIAAERDNSEGIVGVAPGARFASWIAFIDAGANTVSDEKLMDCTSFIPMSSASRITVGGT